MGYLTEIDWNCKQNLTWPEKNHDIKISEQKKKNTTFNRYCIYKRPH